MIYILLCGMYFIHTRKGGEGSPPRCLYEHRPMSYSSDTYILCYIILLLYYRNTFIFIIGRDYMGSIFRLFRAPRENYNIYNINNMFCLQRIKTHARSFYLRVSYFFSLIYFLVSDIIC